MALQLPVITESNVYDEHLKPVTAAGKAVILCVRAWATFTMNSTKVQNPQCYGGAHSA